MTNLDAKLMSIDALVKASWGQFKTNFKKLYLVELIGICAVGLFNLVVMGLGWGLVNIFPGIRTGLAPFFIGLVVMGTGLILMWTILGWMIAIARPELSVTDSIKAAQEKLLSFLWVALLNLAIVSLGFMMLFVPGVLFAVWFFFSTFVFVTKDIRGWAALAKSWELVRGRWWPVFGRLLAIWAAGALLSAIPVVGQILSVLMLPFLYVFWFALYANLGEGRP